MPRLTFTQWLVVFIAAIGFLFDIYELLMLPLILKFALLELEGLRPGTPEYSYWVGMLFFVPAFVGGLVGLLGGYLTDLFGRRRMLVVSILMYAFSAFFAAYSTSVEMLLVLRCTTFIGICLEFVAAVAWLAELFPHPRQRELVLGWTQAFSSVGGLAVAGAFWVVIQIKDDLPMLVMPAFLTNTFGTLQNGNAEWRYTLMSGLIPAIPLLVIRPFLPESPIWRQRKDSGNFRRPSYLELFRPEFRRTTIVTTLIIACGYGTAFGVLQQTRDMVPGLPQVASEMEGKPVPKQKDIEGEYLASLQSFQEIGGLAGRMLLAVLAVVIVSRRWLIRAFQLPGLILVPLVYFTVATSNVNLFYVGIFVSGLLTVGQFSFYGNYLPRVYPVYLRGTGAGFAANVGARIMGTSFVWIYAWLATLDTLWGGADAPTRAAYAAATVGIFTFGLGLILSCLLPEPRSEEELNR